MFIGIGVVNERRTDQAKIYEMPPRDGRGRQDRTELRMCHHHCALYVQTRPLDYAQGRAASGATSLRDGCRLDDLQLGFELQIRS